MDIGEKINIGTSEKCEIQINSGLGSQGQDVVECCIGKTISGNFYV